MKSNALRPVFNLVLAALVAYAWYLMIFRGTGALQTTGLKSLKYFTVLSNLLEGFASLFYFLRRNNETDPLRDTLKYTAAGAVTLTLLVVLGFLGPIFGYPFMFRGANFYFHLLIPLLSIAEFIFWNTGEMGRKENRVMMLPIALYGVYYLGNIAINGIGTFPNKNDWYGFFLFGNRIAVVIIIILFTLNYMIGFTLRKLNQKIINRQ